MTHTDDTAQAGDQNAQALIEELQQQIALLQEELSKFKDLAGRAQADLQNAKARVEREADEMRKFAGEHLIRRMLPTLDNFQRAFLQQPDLKKYEGACPELVEWVKGVAAIEQDLMQQMTAAGLKRMQSLGQHVDPSKHEILSAGPGAIDTVTEVFDEGYELHGKVVRPAKVRVGDGSES